jgi:glycosyltransferase involved in cell wall biosynthesis
MNILFLVKYHISGGIPTVTNVLSQKFTEEGHRVSIACLLGYSETMLERKDRRVRFHHLNNFSASKRNIENLRKIIINEKTDIIISQWGLPFVPVRVVKRAISGLNVKLISVYHTDPAVNARLQTVENQLKKTKSFFTKIILYVKWLVSRCVTGISMNYVYRHSDSYILLSESYRTSFRRFAFLRNISKVKVITNPITIEPVQEISPDFKKKEVIFVGRLENTSKRIDRIIDVWEKLHENFEDWRLIIVGDGNDRQSLERRAQQLNLKRIEFTGFVSPIDYYKRASILLLTSDFEGLPLVLAEAMSCGVIPVVYGSFSSVYDIISSGEDGILIPPQNNAFNTNVMAMQVAGLMYMPEKIKKMSKNAIEKSKKFNVEKVYSEWLSIF